MSGEEPKKEDHFEKLKAKLFDEKHFKTLIIGGAGTEASQGELDEMLLAIAGNDLETAEKEECLKLIREKNALPALTGAIRRFKNEDKKALLVAACWESGIDCSSELLFFAELACNDHYRLALEAFTVIENLDQLPPIEEVTKAKTMISEKIKEAPETLPLLNDLHDRLNDLAQQ